MILTCYNPDCSQNGLSTTVGLCSECGGYLIEVNETPTAKELIKDPNFLTKRVQEQSSYMIDLSDRYKEGSISLKRYKMLSHSAYQVREYFLDIQQYKGLLETEDI